MYTTTTKGYARMLKKCWEKKMPLHVYGGYGIGKSVIPRQVFRGIAETAGKEFIEWQDTTDEQKMNIIANADKYFVFCDQRVGQMDSTDLRGIPNMMNTDMLKTVPYAWVIYFTQPKAHGVLFFDELNLAPPTVSGSAYQIINDRTISDRRIGDDVLLIGAGNRAEDRANVFPMPAPLKDRFVEMEIKVDADEWTEWAAANVNSHFVSFIKWKPALLYKPDTKGSDKASTPRGIERASKMLGDEDITTSDAFEIIAASLGEGFAAQFQAYAKYYAQLSWEKIYSNPETVKGFEVDKTYAVVGGMTDQFVKGVKPDRFGEMMDVVMELSPDFAIVALKMMKDSNHKGFVSQIKKYKNFNKIVKEYAKFIVD